MIAVADLADALRRRHPADAPAELHRHGRPERARRRGDGASSSDRLPARHQPGARATRSPAPGEPHCNFSVAETKTRLGALIDRLDERFGTRDRRPAAASRRLPARLRPALGRRPRLPGHDRPRRGRRHAARPTTSSCAAALGPEPAIGRSLFRRVPTDELDAAVEGLIARLARAARAGRELSGRSRAARATRSSASSPASSRRRSRRDEEEAEAVSTLRADRRAGGGRALDRVRGRGAAGASSRGRSSGSRRGIAISTSFQIDSVALIDMAYEIDPDDPGLQRRHRPPARRDARAGRPAARPLPGAPARADRARRRARSRAMTGKHGVDLFKTSVDLRLLCCNVRKVRPLTKHLHSPRRLDHRASAATSGRAARTSARSRSTTTTARSSS